MFPWRLLWILCLLCAYKIALTKSQVYDDPAVYTYKVSVKTGNEAHWHAPTENHVHIILYGNQSTSPRLLVNGQFKHNSIDTVSFSVQEPLGDIKCISVLLSSSNSIADSWQFESITVELVGKRTWSAQPNIRIYPGDSIQIASGKVECVAPRPTCGYLNRYQHYVCRETCDVCRGIGNMHVYKIRVKTANKRYGNTANHVYLTLYGELGISPIVELDVTNSKDSLDTFTLSSPWPLGEIMCINVFLSSSWSYDYFRFDYVNVIYGAWSGRFPKSNTDNRIYPGYSNEYTSADNKKCGVYGRSSCGLCKVPTTSSATSRKSTSTTSATSSTTTTMRTSIDMNQATTQTTKEVNTTPLTKPIAPTTNTFQPSTETLLTTGKYDEISTMKDEVVTATGVLRSTVYKILVQTTDWKSNNSSTSRVDGSKFNRAQERQTDKGSPTVGIAAGSATGVLVLAAIAGVTVFVLKRRRSKTQSPEIARSHSRPMANPMYSGCDDDTTVTSEIHLDSKDLSALYAQPVKLRKTNGPDYGASDDQYTPDEDSDDLSELYSKPIKQSFRKNKFGGSTNRSPGSNFKQVGGDDGITIYQVAGDFNDIPDDVEYETNDLYSSDNDVTLVTNSLYGDGGDLNYCPTDVPEDDHVHFVENDIYEA